VRPKLSPFIFIPDQHATNFHHRHVDIHDNNKIGGQNEFGDTERSMCFTCSPIRFI